MNTHCVDLGMVLEIQASELGTRPASVGVQRLHVSSCPKPIAEFVADLHDLRMRRPAPNTPEQESAPNERCSLVAVKIAISDIGPDVCSEMFALLSNYYDRISRTQFDNDLRSKHFVILLKAGGAVVGFTSASVSARNFEDNEILVVFSGDTIVDHRYWGQQSLARAWLKAMGKLASEAGSRRLYWFLIVKGHRTYRYLPTFATQYVPSRGGIEDSRLIRLRDALAKEKFGDYYDANTGVLRFEVSRGQLRFGWAEPSSRELRIPDVQFFLHANPGFRNGDELACLTEIACENMTPIGKRWFEEGLGDR